MTQVANFDFMVGLAVGKVLFGALFASQFFRSFAFSGAALGLCYLYFTQGTAGIFKIAYQIRLEYFAQPEFAKGVLVGAAISFLVFGFIRRRQARE